MADSETATEERIVRLQVAAARQEESGRGVARLPRSAMQTLGVTEGDVVQLSGKRSTAAIVIEKTVDATPIIELAITVSMLLAPWGRAGGNQLR